MITITDFVLNSAIIHRLNNQINDGLELSAFTLEIEDDFKEVLEVHCKNALTDKKIRYTKYNTVEDNNVNLKSEYYLKGEISFIEYSHSIANNLYSLMTNKAISPGDLLVADININGERHIALLKLDYKDQYLSKVEIINDKKKISLEKKDNAWPEAGTRLQKAAFIRSEKNLSDETYYDVIMLDRQNRQNNIDDSVASIFFSNSFLNVHLIEDSDTNTIAFIKGAREILGKYEKLGISADKAKEVYDYALNQVVNVDRINVVDFINNYFDKEEGYEQQHTELRDIFYEAGLKRTEFEKSNNVATIYKKNRKFYLNGIKLTVDTNIYNDTDKFKYKIYKNPAGIEVTDITIKGVELKKLE